MKSIIGTSGMSAAAASSITDAGRADICDVPALVCFFTPTLLLDFVVVVLKTFSV